MIIEKLECVSFPVINKCVLRFDQDNNSQSSIQLIGSNLTNTFVTHPNSLAEANSFNNSATLNYHFLFKFLKDLYEDTVDFSNFNNASFSILFRDTNDINSLYWYSCLITDLGYVTQRLSVKKGLNSIWETLYDFDDTSNPKENNIFSMVRKFGPVFYFNNKTFSVNFQKVTGLYQAQQQLLGSEYGDFINFAYDLLASPSIREAVLSGLRSTSFLITKLSVIPKDSNDYIYRFSYESSNGGIKYLIQHEELIYFINVLAICISKITGILVILNNFDLLIPDNIKSKALRINRVLFMSREGFKNSVPGQRIIHLCDKNIQDSSLLSRFLPTNYKLN